MNGNVVLVPGR